MDREYLEDYEQKEKAEYEKLIKRINEGKFCFEKDRYPPDERFINLQEPVASVFTPQAVNMRNLWAQVPFCGSLIFSIPPFPKHAFEELYFKVSEIPKIVDFIKETGKLQVALSAPATDYTGLDFLDQFFLELNPPGYYSIPISILGSDKEVRRVKSTFYTLGKIAFLDFVKEKCLEEGVGNFSLVVEHISDTYIKLKLMNYAFYEDIDDLIVDDPRTALAVLSIYRRFIVYPREDLRVNFINFTLEDLRTAQYLPLVYRPREIRFPCEIGKLLLKKLTYAAQNMRACYDIIDNYDAYDLQTVQQSLNEAIVTNHPDIVNKSASELSEILDNVWNDKALPRRVKGLQIGIPLSMAAIGSVAAGPIGAAGGLLAGLGYSVADKFIDLGTEGFSERLAKLKTKSYQANIYDFKKKYRGKIAHP